jgi:hypothetical protein
MPAAGAAPAAWTAHGRFRPNPNSPGCRQPRAPGSSSSRLGYPDANDVANGSSDHVLARRVRSSLTGGGPSAPATG